MPIQTRRIGDTLIPLKVQLVRPKTNTPVDLTGLTVYFKMVDEEGYEVVSEGDVTIEDAATGKVSYTFQDYDVETAGEFYAYFVVADSYDLEHFPSIPKSLIVRITTDVS